jgi:hypothetical protein
VIVSRSISLVSAMMSATLSNVAVTPVPLGNYSFPLIGKSISKANAFVCPHAQFATALLLKQHER